MLLFQFGLQGSPVAGGRGRFACTPFCFAEGNARKPGRPPGVPGAIPVLLAWRNVAHSKEAVSRLQYSFMQLGKICARFFLPDDKLLSRCIDRATRQWQQRHRLSPCCTANVREKEEIDEMGTGNGNLSKGG